MRQTAVAPRPATRSRLGEPDIHPVTAADGTGVRLSRYHAGDKGPVVLAPGYGNAARVFALETVDRNVVDELAGHGYDVWLFDYRASPDLPASAGQFTVDDIARFDYPAAIAEVRRASGADTVQVLAHCVGSMALVMALAAGLEGVRSAICSQLGAHPIPTPANRARARVGLASMLKRAGIDTLTTDFDGARRDDRALDALMRRLPGDRDCDSPVCRRISFIYGDVFDHRHLNAATHSAIGDVFGISNMTFFEHVARMVRAGHVVDRAGHDAYLAHLDRLNLPITFLHGEHNRMFLPRSTEATYRLLSEVNGPQMYARHVIRGYAHLDCWLGVRAHTDVFPLAVSELDRHN